ncbi:MAG TPA: hypothetical protein VGO55_04020 [Allosphingosinicella sp.]|jgi:hypothetical protein|nr:hypothetical protein [Allosphingosinicella sp.]
MRRVDRGKDPPPATLNRKDKNGKTELDRAIAHYEADPPLAKTFKFQVYKSDEVKRRLEALFHGKCAYCETYYEQSAPMDVEHYRPKGAVHDSTHPGYWWIAMAWDNLLPSCIDCNRKRNQLTPVSSNLLTLNLESRTLSSNAAMLSGKKDSFPLENETSRIHPRGANFGDEQPLLLDPCRHDPSEHLAFYIDRENLISLVLPKASAGPAAIDQLPPVGDDVVADAAAEAEDKKLSRRGAVSIQVYGLNRLGLVQARTALLRRLDFLESLVAELGALADGIEFTQSGAKRPLNDRDSNIVRQLPRLQLRTLDQMRDMAAPHAEFSELAVTWIRQFRDKRLAADPATEAAPR